MESGLGSGCGRILLSVVDTNGNYTSKVSIVISDRKKGWIAHTAGLLLHFLRHLEGWWIVEMMSVTK